jgi:putative nucleotidyltransferase with HDIG domain
MLISNPPPVSEAPPQTALSDPGSAAWVGAALEAALHARAPTAYASTPLLCQLAGRVGRELGIDAQSRELLDVAMRVRDIGMIALPDSVVLATTPLSPADWELVNRHPVIGQELLEALSVTAAAGQIVRSHHERWDGDGYPDGLHGDEIPLLSRVIAACDTFVAIARDRPHRRGMGGEAALELILQERGAQFDPVTVDALAASLPGHGGPSPAAHGAPAPAGNGAPPAATSRAPANRARPYTTQALGKGLDLTTTIAEFDDVPALAPAYERALAASGSGTATVSELIAAVEGDIGLTIAVLRRAQSLAGRHPIDNVADAVIALGSADTLAAIKPLPRAEFPWRTSQLEVLMHRSLVHAQAVARATDRIARDLDLVNHDSVLVAALLHDIGKLVLGRAVPDYTGDSDRTRTPEARVRLERRAWAVDHAALGGLLLRRWGLPDRLAEMVAAHHSAEAENDVATYVRLADMVAHHAQGDAVDRAKMLDLTRLCGLSPHELREILFDLPHSGGSDRRRAGPSPLSTRETAVLRRLAEGKVYKVIALELGLATSTVRSHLQHVYTKLAVDDRAQAVLLATEMGWI